MKIKKFNRGMLGSNCYIIHDRGEGVLIDPCVQVSHISEYMELNDILLKYLVITHAHIDHMLFLEEIREKTKTPVAIHVNEASFLADPLRNGSLLFGMNRVFRKADWFLEDGGLLEAGGMEFRILWTPGHSPGGISILTGDHVFTGDTLFRESVGRTDLGNGDASLLSASIRNHLFVLPDCTAVHPGHGADTTIGHEKKYNIYI